ncbi:MAG: threonine/serine exporter family protein [Rudaea sp.]|uniref:threonine/serine ThrE exporter family protein n=1 Tax=Rudaea sp. TaxID=2136325 RepID=UPI0039E4D7B5
MSVEPESKFQAHDAIVPSARAPLHARIAFVVETARRLHQYGTSAPRLESALDKLAARLDLRAQVWSSPTAIIFSFADRDDEGHVSETTRVVRLAPGDIDLHHLVEVNEIADKVVAAELDIIEGAHLLHTLNDRIGRRAQAHEVLCYGLVSATLAALMRGAWVDVAAAGCIGLVVGLVAQLSAHSQRARLALEAVSAMIATFLATLISLHLAPLTLKTTVLASLIVLFPGMTLTTAVRELSTRHLVSGVARMADAITILIKLAFGTLVANELCKALGLVPSAQPQPPVPDWGIWVALIFGAYGFAVLFRAARRDFPLVMVAAALGYAITYFGSRRFSPEFGVFLAGAIMGALSNLYARVSNRPGALVREPGIILLVPGSLGFLTVSAIVGRDVFLGINTAASLLVILVSLVAGLLFGDLIVAPRRAL